MSAALAYWRSLMTRPWALVKRLVRDCRALSFMRVVSRWFASTAIGSHSKEFLWSAVLSSRFECAW